MKVVHIIPSIGSSGGAERLVVQLASTMAETNDVKMITYRNIAENSNYIKELSKNVECYSMGKTKGFDMFLSFKLARLLKNINPDIVNAHLPSSFLYLVLSVLLLKKTSFVFTIHSLPMHEENRRWIIIIRKILYKTGRLSLVTLSEMSDFELQSYYGIKSSAIIPNGIIQPKTSDKLESVRHEISQMKTSKETLVLINIGRIDENKNQKMLCDVINRLRLEKKRDALLLIIGEPSNASSDYYNMLRDNNYENVYFLGLKSNIADYLMCADTFCLTSFKEGLPLVVLEAMSFGLPIISTPVGGVPDVIEDKINGMLSSDFTLDSYFQTLDNFFDLTLDEIKKISANNIFKFNKYFTIDKTADNYLDLYKRLTNK